MITIKQRRGPRISKHNAFTKECEVRESFDSGGMKQQLACKGVKLQRKLLRSSPKGAHSGPPMRRSAGAGDFAALWWALTHSPVPLPSHLPIRHAALHLLHVKKSDAPMLWWSHLAQLWLPGLKSFKSPSPPGILVQEFRVEWQAAPLLLAAHPTN